jgi:maltose O-acetyltransferase
MVISRLFGFLREAYRRNRSSLRVVSWRLQGANIGEGVKLYGEIYIDGSLRNLKIGSNSTINHNVYLNCRDILIIGEHCNISVGAKLITTGLQEGETKKNRIHISSKIILKENVWVGAGAIILSGCEITSHVVVGAGSLINKNIQTEGVYVGTPARKLK